MMPENIHYAVLDEEEKSRYLNELMERAKSSTPWEQMLRLKEEEKKAIVEYAGELRIHRSDPYVQVHRDSKREVQKERLPGPMDYVTCYFMNHQVPYVLHWLMRKVLIERPDDPIKYMAQVTNECSFFYHNITNLEHYYTPDHLEAVFRSFDPSGTGSITLTQFIEAVRTLGVAGFITNVPANENGMVQKEEFLITFENCFNDIFRFVNGDPPEQEQVRPETLEEEDLDELEEPSMDWYVKRGKKRGVLVLAPHIRTKDLPFPPGVHVLNRPAMKGRIFNPPYMRPINTKPFGVEDPDLPKRLKKGKIDDLLNACILLDVLIDLEIDTTPEDAEQEAPDIEVTTIDTDLPRAINVLQEAFLIDNLEEELTTEECNEFRILRARIEALNPFRINQTVLEGFFQRRREVVDEFEEEGSEKFPSSLEGLKALFLTAVNVENRIKSIDVV